MSKVVTLGEIMLRLKSPNKDRFFQSPSFEATFGGGEANVAVSLSILGKDAFFVTAVPDNPMGEAAISELKKYGVNTQFINKEKNGRLGIYFLEEGACNRPSVVVYDREGSAISKAKSTDFQWENIFQDANWFHITGITPAISETAGNLSLDAVKEAKKRGLTVSVDLNYRKKLWNYGKNPPEVMGEIVKYADILIANEEDIQKSLGIDLEKEDFAISDLKIESYKKLIKLVQNKYPNINFVAVTLRESFSADKNAWSAILSSKNDLYISKKYLIEDIVDRVGGGDAFSAGLIFALSEYKNDFQFSLDFAVAASCLKHTFSGDFNLARKSEILALVNGNTSGRVQR